MNEGKGNVVLLTIIAIATLLISVVGATFAYFTAVYSGGDDIPDLEIMSGSIGTVFDGGAVVTAANISPSRGDEYGNHPSIMDKPKTFTLKHTSDAIAGVKAHYIITLVINQNEFGDGSLKYTMVPDPESDNNGQFAESITELTGIPSSGNVTLGTGYFESPTDGEATHIYNLDFYYPSWGSEQNEEQGAEFKAYLSVTSPDGIEGP